MCENCLVLQYVSVETHVHEHKQWCVCILEHLAPFTLPSSCLILISLLMQLVNKDVDSQTDGEEKRPSMDLFKAIFASSSEEKSSSSEDEQGDSEDDQEGAGEADFKSSQEEPSSVAHSTSVFQTLGPKGENSDVSREAAALFSV